MATDERWMYWRCDHCARVQSYPKPPAGPWAPTCRYGHFSQPMSEVGVVPRVGVEGDARDVQIGRLREERDWLRKAVEAHREEVHARDPQDVIEDSDLRLWAALVPETATAESPPPSATDALVDLAARAVAEPRRFLENEDGLQQALGQAIAQARLGRAESPRRPDHNCTNCDGRGCMPCVLREVHYECVDDCPLCCAAVPLDAVGGPSPVVSSSGLDWEARVEAGGARIAELEEALRAIVRLDDDEDPVCLGPDYWAGTAAAAQIARQVLRAAGFGDGQEER